MTRRDFQLIADVIRVDASNARAGAESMTVQRIAVRMANTLATTNPRFDRERFLTACGVVA